MKQFLNLVLALLLLVQSSCSWHVTAKAKKPASYRPPSSTQMTAGVGQADLTAPPGHPMSGYSINGRISRGYWVRPKATAFYLCDSDGTPFVFVATDLWAITDGMKLKVLEMLGNDSATDFIGESELLLTAIHGHQTVGTNVPDDAFTIASIGFSFDRRSFNFTVSQIVAAIRKAIQSVRPAMVSYAVGTVRNIAKNRSVHAYLQNYPAERQQYFSGTLAANQTDVSPEELESMIDQRLTLLSIKEPDGRIRGLLASYPVHPTATGDATEVYSADIFGLASAYACRDLQDHPTIAFYNGAEGDVAPDYQFHNRADAVRIATTLSQSIQQLAQPESQTLLTGKISHRLQMINIASHTINADPFDADCLRTGSQTITRTAKHAMVGAAVLAGASDGRTSLSSFGISDGAQSETFPSEQYPKMPAVNFLAGSVLEIRFYFNKLVPLLLKTAPTAKVPISIHMIGNLCFAGLPGEFTTMLGRRIRKVIASQLSLAENAISLVGLADGYISYVTTPCEYTAQAYEGASTYFGMASGQVFVEEFERLSRRGTISMQDRRGRRMRYKVGLQLSIFGPPHLAKLQTWDCEERLCNLLVANNGTHLHSRFIPGMPVCDTIGIAPDEAVAFSFEDGVKGLSDSDENFYPNLSLINASGDSIPMPEHILTIDVCTVNKKTWTVRIPDITQLPEGPVQILVGRLSDQTKLTSAFFRRR
jgi:neutral ceramidase